MIFHFILFDPTKNDILPDLLTIALSVINFILPSEKLNECLFPSEGEDKDNTTYDAARIQFPTVNNYPEYFYFFVIRIMIEQIQSPKKQL